MYKLRVCTQCDDGREKPTVKGLCQYHYKASLRAKSRPLKKVHKKSGQMDLFKTIFLKRPLNCFVTGVSLRHYLDNKQDFHWLFHHVLPKGLYPRFKLFEPNIIMVLPHVHFDIENMAESDLLKKYPGYYRVLILKEELKTEYNATTKPNPSGG